MNQTPSFPHYGTEEIINSTIQIAAFILGITGFTTIIIISWRTYDHVLIISVLIYGLSLLMMLGFSMVYHLKDRSQNSYFYKCLDHISIFIMIAGTYSPITLISIGGSLGICLFFGVWAIALYGILIRLFFPRRFMSQYLGLYLGFGWLLVPALPWLIGAMPTEGIILIALGGMTYTLGVPFHNLVRLRYHTVIWHSFVIIGAAIQYAAILRDVVLVRG